MAIQNIDLATLFSQNFFITPAGKVQIKNVDGSLSDTIQKGGKIELNNNSNIVNRKSQTGKYGDYYATDKLGRHVFMPLTLGGVFLPYCWLAVKGNKRIVETPMTERRGMVREFISMDDYEFAVKGFVIGHDGTFPEDDIEALRALYERNEAVEARSVLTDIFLLSKEQGAQDKVVIYDLEIMPAQGIEHVRGYSFTLKSDQQFELELIG